MDANTIERHIDALVRCCDQATDETALFTEISERLRRIVPFDGAGWFAVDPATLLGTAPVLVENIDPSQCESYWDRECRVEDALLYRDLARAPELAATLYASTDDHPARSARYREALAPQGYGDELRAALRVGRSTWGVVDLCRDTARTRFSPADVNIVRTVAPAIGRALRTFAKKRGRTGPPHPDDRPGTALFDRPGHLVSLDEQAERLLAEMSGAGQGHDPIPMTAVYAVVARAATVEAGTDPGPAAARLRAASGRWLSLHASCLRDPDGRPGLTALLIEPARPTQIAPIIVEAYGLTPREQEITRAVAHGLSNPQIAAELFVSPHTVRDHLKTIFVKLGVGSRGELMARLFADHYGPALHAADDPRITHIHA